MECSEKCRFRAELLPLGPLGLAPTASFYEILAFAIGVLVQQGFELPKHKQGVIAEIQRDILVEMGVINEGR